MFVFLINNKYKLYAVKTKNKTIKSFFQRRWFRNIKIGIAFVIIITNKNCNADRLGCGDFNAASRRELRASPVEELKSRLVSKDGEAVLVTNGCLYNNLTNIIIFSNRPNHNANNGFI
jgi:hypothetical protein